MALFNTGIKYCHDLSLFVTVESLLQSVLSRIDWRLLGFPFQYFGTCSLLVLDLHPSILMLNVNILSLLLKV